MDTSSRSQISSKLVPAAGLAATAIILAVAVILATRPREPSEPAHVADSHDLRDAQPPRSLTTDAVPVVAEEIKQPPTSIDDSWEEKLDTILSGDGTNKETVLRLLQDFNHLPAEAQMEYIAHALNLCEDTEFGPIEAIYTQSETPAEVREQIFDDALNRPDEIKLPLMARTMATPNHPMQDEAKEILCLYLELDPQSSGSTDWNGRVRSYLQKNAAEE
jgi:hypothetical protein